MNLRLIRVFIYLSQFRLNIRYRSNKRHVLFDVLFRLSTNESFMNDDENLNLKSYHADWENSSINDQRFVYHEILINIFVVFRQRLIDEYVKKKTWINLIEMLIDLKKRLQMKKFFHFSIKNNQKTSSKIFLWSSWKNLSRRRQKIIKNQKFSTNLRRRRKLSTARRRKSFAIFLIKLSRLKRYTST